MTPYHAKYFAHELTRRCPSNSLEKLAGTLIDAQVDLNPHQVDAALFAFNSPLSQGAILADEVGLGKTIEAGILLSQHWAERKRRILIIMPASLRKQWNRELAEKFFLPSVILETATFKKAVKAGNANPFDDTENIVICSYQFAANRSEQLMTVPWDLVVIDEAHRLRNVYKPQNKVARKLRTALENRRKILLTATPLQNSLLELFGLVSFIDEYAFGDVKSFRSQYSRLNEESFSELKRRIAPICQRTLRRQVVEYIKFTNREALTRKFVPTEDEQTLYDLVSEYLQRDDLEALPASQRSLMTLVMRKLLASSTFAIAGALDSLVRKLRGRLRDDEKLGEPAEMGNEIAEDFEEYDTLSEEWTEQDAAGLSQDELEELDAPIRLTPGEIAAIESEIFELENFRDLATSITENAKGDALVEGLDAGFARLRTLGAAEKAIIFTESRRTQEYLVRRLEKTAHGKKIVLFNGSNNDPKSREIYASWKAAHLDTDKISGSSTADMRAALVEYFRDEATIMIATEAAAEGINLQFCSLVVNYDLPWNPQRIEQRIGRCHRYGQKHDVVVMNFLNTSNAADQRVFELLEEKFQLFSGVFGASDEVLGSIENGVDFERRIVEIYQKCRTQERIQQEFDFLREEMDEQIGERMQETRQQLMENFDAEVHDRLKFNLDEGRRYLDRYERLLWRLTSFVLADRAAFFPEDNAFILGQQPYPDTPAVVEATPLGRYEMAKEVEHAHRYRLGHPLAQAILDEGKSLTTATATLIFDYTADPQSIELLKPLVGQSGSLSASRLSVTAGAVEDHLLFAARTDAGETVSDEACHRLFSLSARVAPLEEGGDNADLTALSEALAAGRAQILAEIQSRNAAFFDQEMEKLDHWGDDQRRSLKSDLDQIDVTIRGLKKEIRQAASVQEKFDKQRKASALQRERDEKWKAYDVSSQEIGHRTEELLDEIGQRLDVSSEETEIFSIRWQVI